MCLSKKEEILIDFLILFYKDRIEILKDIIYQNNPLSLRLIDWLVTNYSKKYNIIYPINKKGEDVIYFNIYLDYKNQLKAYSKKFFDPFCRQKRIIIDCETFLWKEYSEPDPVSTNDSTNIVENICVWDGGTEWTPPANTLMLVQATTPALIWEAVIVDKIITDYVLVEEIGVGDIGFTWNATTEVLTTNQSKPPIPKPKPPILTE
jgi:hypothetical protein